FSTQRSQSMHEEHEGEMQTQYSGRGDLLGGGSSNVPIEQILQQFLLARTRPRRNLLRGDALGDLFERALTSQHRLALRLVPAGVAFGERLIVLAIFNQLRGGNQGLGADVKAANMGDEQVLGVDRLTPQLGVEIESARRDAAAL